ncbi:aldehyde dehydrogenase family protein [Patescibacteria group bacterium]|nr:aldehyde dehydrogenase family protein [Patescibacteria group bacterium]
MKKLISTNPAKNYEVIGQVDISMDEEIKEKVELANKAKLAWKELGVKKRIEFLRPIHEEFKKRKGEFSLLITKEMGKPITEAKIDGFLEEFGWFLDNGEKAFADEITHEDEKSIHRITYEPYGVAAVITPWNFPVGMFIWGTIPNLIAGNTVVFKISEECPFVGKLIEEIMNSKDLPRGVFSEIYGGGSVGQKLAESKVNLIWFTGSTKVGKLLYKIAAGKFIKAVLEMGGSSPAVLFEDIDVPDVTLEIYTERFRNCGQVCDSVKRLIVHESIFEKVVEGLKQEIEKKIIGDPSSEKTQIGSLVAKRQLDLLESQVKDALEKGAKIIIGGKVPEKLSGAFYEPTILTNITKDMRVWTEEVFGPVFPIVSFKTEEEAIELANDTSYGLGSRVYSKNIECAKRVASKIEAGTVEINHGSRWLPCNPFGGFKSSGMGREHGIVGFRELCQIKVISMGK